MTDKKQMPEDFEKYLAERKKKQSEERKAWIAALKAQNADKAAARDDAQNAAESPAENVAADADQAADKGHDQAADNGHDRGAAQSGDRVGFQKRLEPRDVHQVQHVHQAHDGEPFQSVDQAHAQPTKPESGADAIKTVNVSKSGQNDGNEVSENPMEDSRSVSPFWIRKAQTPMEELSSGDADAAAPIAENEVQTGEAQNEELRADQGELKSERLHEALNDTLSDTQSEPRLHGQEQGIPLFGEAHGFADVSGSEHMSDTLDNRGSLSWKDRARLILDRGQAYMKQRANRRSLGGVADQKEERTRQKKTFLLCAVGVLGLMSLFVLMGETTRKTKPAEVKIYQSDFRVAPDSIDKQSFQSQYEEKIDVMTAKLKSYEATLESLNNRIRMLDQAKTKRSEEKPQGKAVPIEALSDFNPEKEVDPNALFDNKGPATREPVTRMGVVKVYESAAAPAGKLGAANHASESAARRRVSYARQIENPIAANRARHEAENTYLPAGSFMNAVVLSGVTAATGGNAANNPVPMLMEIKDFARLPNAFRANVKRCFVTGSATGDLSSERIWVRLDRLSCMAKNGKALDMKVQGYATGEDGKTGVRARLVTRSGQAIASAITTGLLSGMGKAVSLSASSTMTYSSGATGTTVNDSLRAGIGQGMEDAFDRIVDYYLRLADKIFPVLELDSGRRVDLVLAQGLTISFDQGSEVVDDTNAAAQFGMSVRGESN